MRIFKVIEIHHKDPFDMESIAVIRDENTQISLNVVINDHYVDSEPSHISGLYSKLEKGEYIQGELYLVLVSKTTPRGDTYFIQNRRITPDIGSPSFIGEFEIDSISNDSMTVLKYPNSDMLLKLESDYNLNESSECLKTIALRGELFLETIGYPNKEGVFK